MRPTPIASKPIWQAGTKLYNMANPIPRMSWNPANTFNIWQRTSPESAHRREITFTQSSRSLFQQRWVAKRFLKGYHSHLIRTKQFERWYLPSRIPAIHAKQPANAATQGFVEGRERAGGRTREERFARTKKEVARAPTGSMMYLNAERRLDVCVFRACFAESVYQARRLVVGGNVKLNGQTIRNANTLLNPGDVFTVNAAVIPFLQKPKADKSAEAAETAESADENAEESATQEAGSAAESAEATADSTESATAEATETTETAASSSTPAKTSKEPEATSWFNLPPFAQAHIFVPAYLLPSYLTCSAVYVRHPTARAGYSEIPSPYDAGGDLMALGWEWYSRKAPRMRTKVTRWWNPQRTKERTQIPRPRDSWDQKMEERSVIKQIAQSPLGKRNAKLV